MDKYSKKFDKGKLQFRLITPRSKKALAEVLTFGAEKYGANSWQGVPNGKERYYDALLRHLNAWELGEDIDSESGLHHLAHAMANIMFLYELHTKD